MINPFHFLSKRVGSDNPYRRIVYEEYQRAKKSFFSPVSYFTVSFCLFLCLISLFGDDLAEILEFDRYKIADGQVWRLITGNFVHFGWYHTSINIMGTALVAYGLFTQSRLWVWAGIVFLLPLFDGLGLYLLSADTGVYRGYSGVVYGLASFGLVMSLHKMPWLYGAVLLALWGKIVHQQLPTTDLNYLMEQIGVGVSADAHLWGAGSGVILGCIYRVLDHKKQVATDSEADRAQ